MFGGGYIFDIIILKNNNTEVTKNVLGLKWSAIIWLSAQKHITDIVH